LRQAALGELCRTLVIDTYAPAAVLINRSHECLYSLGPTDRYLHVPAGNPTHDLFAMARPDLRTKLRSAIQRAGHEKSRIVVPGGDRATATRRFRSTSTFSRFRAVAKTCC